MRFSSSLDTRLCVRPHPQHVPTPDDYFEHACGRGIPFVFPFSAPTELLGLPAGGAAADLLEALCERIGDEEARCFSQRP